MVRWPERHGVWLLLGAMTVLLAVLAALQYRWTGEIGRAEADRQRTRLERASQRFARELGHEVGQAMSAFARPDRPRGGDSDPRESLLRRLEAWSGSEHAGLVSRLVLVTVGESGPKAEAVSSGRLAFVETPLPAWLEPVARQLEALASGDRPPRRGIRPDSFLTNPPGFLVPVIRLGTGEPFPAGPGSFRLDGMALVELDETYLGEVLLPELAEIHFGPLSEGDFAVAVLRREDQSVLYSSDPDLRPAELARAEVRVDLAAGPGRFGGPRGGFDRRLPSRRPPRPGGRGRGRWESELGPGPRDEGAAVSPWVLVVRHRGGSLAQSVATVRRRNLAVGFGVLALLGGAALLLARGGQRARNLARQQLEFVAGVTHELHTPLAAIRSAGQNLADGVVTEPGQIQRYGELIQKEGTRLSGLVAQVLDFAGIESGSAAYSSEPVQLPRLVREVVGDLALVLEQAGVEVEVDLPEDLPPVRGDADALRRALENLVANATKFARTGRWVGIKAAAGPRVDTVTVRVEDRGPGIPKAERERVFEPFYRGRDARGHQSPGSGLGLSLVHHVVEAQGGRVAVEGREGGGASVVLELPAVENAGEASA